VEQGRVRERSPPRFEADASCATAEQVRAGRAEQAKDAGLSLLLTLERGERLALVAVDDGLDGVKKIRAPLELERLENEGSEVALELGCHAAACRSA
jgi:hypothetical protein